MKTEPPATGPLAPSSSETHLRALARGGGLNYVGAIISAAMSLVLVVAVARGAGRTQAGAFWAALSLFLILETVSKFGSDTGTVYFVSRYLALGRRADVAVTLRRSVTTVVTGGILVGGALFVFAPWVSSTVLGHHTVDSVPLLRIFAVAMPLIAAYDILLSASRGFGSMSPTVLVDKIGVAALQPLLIVVLLATGVGAERIVGGWTIPYVLGVVAAYFFLRRRLRSLRSTGVKTGSRDLRREFYSYTAPRAVAGVCQSALARLDVVLISALRSPGEAAIYAAVTRFLVLGQLGVVAVQQAMSPKIGQLLAREDLDSARAVYQTATAWLVALSWPVYLMFAVYGVTVLDVLGRGYAAAGASVVTLLAVGMLFSAASGPVDTLLLMSGRSARSLFNRIFALVVNVAVDLVLIPHLGIRGAAIGWAVALVAVNTTALFQVRSMLHMHPLGAGTRASIVLSLVCFGAVPLAVRFIAGTGVVAFVVAALIAVALYVAGAWRARDVLYLRMLSELVPSRRGRRRPRAEPALPNA